MDLFAPENGAAALKLSLDELVAQTDRDLAERELYQQAARSALYGPRWQAAGIRPERLAGRAALRQLPTICGDDLLAMSASDKSLRRALLTRPRLWVASQGTASRPKKWLPLTLQDTAHWFSRARRVLELVTGGDDAQRAALLLAMNAPMPHVSNAVPYLWERADYLAGPRRIEFLIAATSMLWRNHWHRFALLKHPDWLAGSVADARLLAQELGADAGSLLQQPGRGIFWGEPLDGAEAELRAAFGLAETFAIYFSAECREMYAECPAHDGLHLWMDGAVHEVLPDGTAEAAAIFVDEAAAGTEGEYVVTTLSEALPLVRYRTGDRIRVVSTEPCACGITHPRVRFLGRMGASGVQS